MRTIDSSISVLKPSNIAWWHTSWTGRFILAALLIAAAAFVLTPGRTSAQAPPPLDAGVICQAYNEMFGSNDNGGRILAADLNDGLVADCEALVAIANSLGDPGNMVNWIGEATIPDSLLLEGEAWTGVMVDSVDDVMRVTAVELPDESFDWVDRAGVGQTDRVGDTGPLG